MYLSVIIPAYKEEKRIGKTLLAVDQYLSKQRYQYEIIMVSDEGSPNKTVEVVKNFQKMVKNLRIIENEKNHGKGFAVRQGMLEAQGDYRLFMDADNSTTVDQVENFLPWFNNGFDVVIGSRAIKGAKIDVHQPFYKELLGKLGNKVIQIVAVWGVKDTQAGFKCFSAQAAQDIFSKTMINHWSFDVEVLALARKLNYKIKEVPIEWTNDKESRVKLSSYIEVLMETFKIRFNLMTGKYNK